MDGHNVSVVSMLEPTAFSEELTAAGIPVVSLSMSRSGANVRGIAQFLSYLRRFQPDIIHAHMFHASILARLARIALGTPVVCTVHSEIECSHLKKSGRLREWIYRLTARASNCTTAVSHRVRDRYVTKRLVHNATMPVIENGVDVDRFTPNAERRIQLRESEGWSNRFVWLAVGRLEDPKDYPRMVRAFRPIHERWPSALLVIAGEGRLREKIEAAIATENLQSAVQLLGSRKDVPDLMNAADAFVLCSEWEGCQLVLLEAGAAALPSVATSVGAAPQIVLPGRTGFLVPPGDTESLAHAMASLMQVPEKQRVSMGGQARLHIVDHYSIHNVHGHYQQIYEDILAERS
jgi:glycosyltransferase involved in cell wall biosynthesis